MRIKMLEDRKASPDNYTHKWFFKGEEYDVAAQFGRALYAAGVCEIIKDEAKDERVQKKGKTTKR